MALGLLLYCRRTHTRESTGSSGPGGVHGTRRFRGYLWPIAPTADDLRTIRRLSQYRPFERGGQSARERKEDLILAGLAEAGGACTSIGDCAATLRTLWGLRYDDLELADPIAHLIAEGRIVRNTSGAPSLSTDEQRRLEAAAAESQANAREALDD